ncbi:MAG: methionine ABC transporter permease [Sarcina sp.]
MEILKILAPAFLETIYMVFFSTFFAILFGFIIAIILIITDTGGFKENKVIYKSLDIVINILRGFPFIILIIFLIPLTRFLMGSAIGATAVIVPLTIGATPFVARIIESALNEVDDGVIEAAKSFGASDMQIVFKVMLKEATPSIISGITLTVITIIGYSAMAGTIGGGGLGDVAVRYGVHRGETDVLNVTVIVLIIVVQALQSLGNYFYKKLK